MTPETRLLRVDVSDGANCETKVGALLPRDAHIVLHKGDFLILTSDPLIGKPAEIDRDGRVLRPARISCTLPEVLSRVRIGERIWFDDGKIGGIVKEFEPDALRIEITHARAKGERLLADKGINLPDTDIELPGLTPRTWTI